uniref:HTH_Tnp_Tc3_2 domain-containing protein n=1 Tax=Heterorhabditis bacteriophora TaxID=37862 RepID=A0A1I7WG27_HETBA
MSKGKNITSNQREMIRILLDQNLSQSGILENAPRTRRNRNTTKRIDGTIRRQCEDNRQLIARDIHDEVKVYRECSLSVTPIRQRLVEPRIRYSFPLKNWRARVAIQRIGLKRKIGLRFQSNVVLTL